MNLTARVKWCAVLLLTLNANVGLSAGATKGSGATKGATTAKKVETTREEAKATALKLVPGKVLEVEREKHQGEPVYSVEIRAADGVHEIVVKIADGTVIENSFKGEHEEEEDGDEDDGDGEEHESK